MIPSAQFVTALHDRLVAMGKVRGTCDEAAIAGLLRIAASLATSVEEEPAALLYACGRYPRAFGAGWVFLAGFLVEHQSAAVGRMLIFGAEDLRALLGRVARQQDDLEAVATWIAARSITLPTGSSRAPRGQG